MLTTAPRCDGCKYNLYSAPNGQPWNRQPHSRCRWFNICIPMVIEKVRGCDGHMNAEWISSEIPPGCPVHSQQQLF